MSTSLNRSKPMSSDVPGDRLAYHGSLFLIGAVILQHTI